MNKSRVVHCKKETYDVYIGRPSIWGNPFVVGKDGDRNQCVELYREWIKIQPKLIERAKKELKDKVLGCWCHPNKCHGDVLLEIANQENSNNEEKKEN